MNSNNEINENKRNLTLSGRDFIFAARGIKEVYVLIDKQDISVSKKLTYLNKHNISKILFIFFMKRNQLANNIFLWNELQYLKSSFPKTETEKLKSLESLYATYFGDETIYNNFKKARINRENIETLENIIKNKEIDDTEVIKKLFNSMEKEIEKEIEKIMPKFSLSLKDDLEIVENLCGSYNRKIDNQRVSNLDINKSVDERLEYLVTDMKLLTMWNENLIIHDLLFYFQVWMKIQSFKNSKNSPRMLNKLCNNLLMDIHKDFIVQDKIKLSYTLSKNLENIQSIEDDKVKLQILNEITEQVRILFFFYLSKFTTFVIQFEQNKWMQEFTCPAFNPSMKLSNLEKFLLDEKQTEFFISICDQVKNLSIAYSMNGVDFSQYSKFWFSVHWMLMVNDKFGFFIELFLKKALERNLPDKKEWPNLIKYDLLVVFELLNTLAKERIKDSTDKGFFLSIRKMVKKVFELNANDLDTENQFELGRKLCKYAKFFIDNLEKNFDYYMLAVFKMAYNILLKNNEKKLSEEFLALFLAEVVKPIICKPSSYKLIKIETNIKISFCLELIATAIRNTVTQLLFPEQKKKEHHIKQLNSFITSNDGKLQLIMDGWLSTENSVIEQKLEKTSKFTNTIQRKSPEFVKLKLCIYNYCVAFRYETEILYDTLNLEKGREMGSWDEVNFWFSILPDMQLGKKLRNMEMKDSIFHTFSSGSNAKDLKRTHSLPPSKLQQQNPGFRNKKIENSPIMNKEQVSPKNFIHDKKSPSRVSHSPRDRSSKRASQRDQLMIKVLNDEKVSNAEKLLHIYQQPTWSNDFVLWMQTLSKHTGEEDQSQLFYIFQDCLKLKEHYLQATKHIYETIVNSKINLSQKVISPLKMDPKHITELYVLQGLEKELEGKLIPFVEKYINSLKESI